MKRGFNERRFVGFAGIILILSTLVFGYLGVVGREGEPPIGKVDRPGDYPEFEASSAVQVGTPWRAPKAMPRGANWLYDLFTPPEVYYDAQSGKFRLTAPSRESESTAPENSKRDLMPGLYLHAVEREPFPLQLIGFIGEEGNFMGTFANLVTRETLLLRQGAKVDSLKMVVREFRVERITTAIPDSMSVRESRAVAVLHDELTGRKTMLRQGERSFTDVLIARVSLTVENGGQFTVREGGLVDSGLDQFRIEKIRLAPPEIDVTKVKQPAGDAEAFTIGRQASTDYPDDEE